MACCGVACITFILFALCVARRQGVVWRLRASSLARTVGGRAPSVALPERAAHLPDPGAHRGPAARARPRAPAPIASEPRKRLCHWFGGACGSPWTALTATTTCQHPTVPNHGAHNTRNPPRPPIFKPTTIPAPRKESGTPPFTATADRPHSHAGRGNPPSRPPLTRR